MSLLRTLHVVCHQDWRDVGDAIVLEQARQHRIHGVCLPNLGTDVKVGSSYVHISGHVRTLSRPLVEAQTPVRAMELSMISLIRASKIRRHTNSASPELLPPTRIALQLYRPIGLPVRMFGAVVGWGCPAMAPPRSQPRGRLHSWGAPSFLSSVLLVLYSSTIVTCTAVERRLQVCAHQRTSLCLRPCRAPLHLRNPPYCGWTCANP